MNIEWALLRRSLIHFITILCIGLVVISWLWFRYDKVHQNFQQASDENNEALQRYQRAASDLKLFTEYRDRFWDFKNKGIIGEEHRLSWAEVLNEENQALSLPSFSTDIAPRRATSIGHPTDTMQWYKSVQQIKMGMLHEGDFYRLFYALSNYADGLYRVASCDLQRAPEIYFHPQAENITADCTLEWFSVQLRKSEEQSNAY